MVVARHCNMADTHWQHAPVERQHRRPCATMPSAPCCRLAAAALLLPSKLPCPSRPSSLLTPAKPLEPLALRSCPCPHGPRAGCPCPDIPAPAQPPLAECPPHPACPCHQPWHHAGCQLLRLARGHHRVHSMGGQALRRCTQTHAAGAADLGRRKGTAQPVAHSSSRSTLRSSDSRSTLTPSSLSPRGKSPASACIASWRLPRKCGADAARCRCAPGGGGCSPAAASFSDHSWIASTSRRSCLLTGDRVQPGSWAWWLSVCVEASCVQGG